MTELELKRIKQCLKSLRNPMWDNPNTLYLTDVEELLETFVSRTPLNKQL
jgi:hypothetical protein